MSKKIDALLAAEARMHPRALSLSASAQHSLKAQWRTNELMSVSLGGPSERLNVRRRGLRKGNSVGGTAHFFNEPLELRRRSDL
jgi:hypothetical protein